GLAAGIQMEPVDADALGRHVGMSRIRSLDSRLSRSVAADDTGRRVRGDRHRPEKPRLRALYRRRGPLSARFPSFRQAGGLSLREHGPDVWRGRADVHLGTLGQRLVVLARAALADVFAGPGLHKPWVSTDDSWACPKRGLPCPSAATDPRGKLGVGSL